MKPASDAVDLSRRAFIRSMPRQLLEGIGHALKKTVVIPAPLDRVARGRQIDKSSICPVQPRVARINIERCLAWGNALCQACYLACPMRDRALEIIDQKPIIHVAACDGCGLCLPACRTVNDQAAIELISVLNERGE